MTIANIADLLDAPPASSGSGAPSQQQPSESVQAAPPDVPAAPSRPLRISVTWGDITHVEADIHVAGHYVGVAPTSAEHALDKAISSASPARAVIAEHTRRGWLVGALGEVTYFPGPEAAGGSGQAVRRVALAGMGRLGTLNEPHATQMYDSLFAEIINLGSARRVAMVLIGSGARNLSALQACRALIAGLAKATSRAWRYGRGNLEEVVVVEIDRLRAEKIRLTLDRIARQGCGLHVRPEIDDVDGGEVGIDSAAAFAIYGLARLLQANGTWPSRDGTPDRTAELLASVPERFRSAVADKLVTINGDVTGLTVVLGEQEDAAGDSTAVRITVAQDITGFRWAALTERSTIPERVVDLDANLVEQLVKRLTAPNLKDAAELPRLLTRCVVPVDLAPHITDQTALVLDVDRSTARLPWEFLTDDAYDNRREAEPLAVRTPLARQLRTQYAGVAGEDVEGKQLRALVIGDPGDAERFTGLPNAREEAIEVAKLLRERGVRVQLFLGGDGTTEGAEPATKLDILQELLGRTHHLVHYAGHGTFDPDDARRTGWLLADGFLGARDLRQMTRAPRLVVANACWSAARPAPSAQPSGASSGAVSGVASGAGSAADLTPVLADEFLRVGVVHYVGTSWRVPDQLGLGFARKFYERLFQPGASVGSAVCEARGWLFHARGSDSSVASPEQWSAWAAYQHYGDPSDTLELTSSSPCEAQA